MNEDSGLVSTQFLRMTSQFPGIEVYIIAVKIHEAEACGNTDCEST